MDESKGDILDYEQYLRQSEPDKRKKALVWATSIGLQQVDGLRPSQYLHEIARRNIEDEITTEQGKQLIATYYEQRSSRADASQRSAEEADRAAANIAHILATSTLDFTSQGFKSLHRRIFDGVFKHAGQLRTYDISKKEWVLRGASVLYLLFGEQWELKNRYLLIGNTEQAPNKHRTSAEQVGRTHGKLTSTCDDNRRQTDENYRDDGRSRVETSPHIRRQLPQPGHRGGRCYDVLSGQSATSRAALSSHGQRIDVLQRAKKT